MDERPRALVVGFTVVPASSADASALLAAARALAHRCEVDIVSIKTDALPHMELVGRARVLRVPLGVGDRAERASAFRRALRRQLEGEPYDVVHVRGALECAVAIQRRSAGAPFKLVYDMAAFPSEDDGPGAEDAWAQAHLRACEAADLVLAPSSAARDGLRMAAGRVEVVPPGVDIDQFDWEPPPPGAGTRVLYLGPYASDRDIPTVVSAARLLSRERELRWLLAGEVDAGRRERVRDMVESFGLQGVIDVRGEPDVEALPLVISSADVCVVPAAPVARYLEHGDIPQPLLEHLACRRPVVVADVPGVSQVVRDEIEGLHYAAADEESLAGQIRTLVDDLELRRALAEAGYRRARDDFNGAARRRRILASYQWLLELEAEPAWGWFVSDPSGVVSLGGRPGGAATGESLPMEHTLVLDPSEADAGAVELPASVAEIIPPSGESATEDEGPRPTTDPQAPQPPIDTAQIELPEDPRAPTLTVDTGQHSITDLARPSPDDSGPIAPPPIPRPPPKPPGAAKKRAIPPPTPRSAAPADTTRLASPAPSATEDTGRIATPESPVAAPKPPKPRAKPDPDPGPAGS